MRDNAFVQYALMLGIGTALTLLVVWAGGSMGGSSGSDGSDPGPDTTCQSPGICY